MCGIAGTLTFGGGAERWRETVGRAMEQMARRGPDDAGLWCDDQACVLGFRRLSILDLTPAGHQPMRTADRRYALVFNGELYNFREIRALLERHGHRFRSSGDAEVVLQALAAQGVEALASFNGMFALAFYDTVEQRLLLARDHAGIKPLYVLHDQDGVFFASQYDQVLSHPWAGRRPIDPASLCTYLHLGFLPPPRALLSGSFAMEPGTWTSVDASGTIRSGRFFEFPRFREPDLQGVEADEALDAAIGAAVRRQMVSDVPLGVFLSGGIDSPLVAAKMREATSATLPAFTLGTGGGPHDESADAMRYASALGLDHVVRHITPGEVLGLLDDVVTAYSEPHDDYSIFPTAMLSQVARERVTVVLSGDGGDDLLWGYPGRMITPIQDTAGGMRRVPRRAARVLASALAHGPRAALAPADHGAVQLRRQRFVRLSSLTGVFPGLPDLPDDQRLFRFDGGGPDRLAQWLRWNEYSGHLVRVLQKVDRASMHASLEVRVPLLDREVIETALRIDWRDVVDLRRGVGKLPLRRALRRYAGFQTSGKRGFTVPMADWLRGPLREAFGDLVASRRDLLGLPMDGAGMQRIVGSHREGDDRDAWLMWRLLSLALWEEKHLHRTAVHA